MEPNALNKGDIGDHIAIGDVVNQTGALDKETIRGVFFKKSDFERRCERLSEEISAARSAKAPE